MGSNGKSKIWLYAVVLFTSAFIVLLVTAFSQIKLNNNLSYLNNQIFTKEHEKNEVQLSFANAQELNGKLSDENKRLQEEVDRLSAEIDKMKADQEAAENAGADKIEAYEQLSRAQNAYAAGNPVDSAQVIWDINISRLDANASQEYSLLREKTYRDAGKQLLNEGYELYTKKEFVSAVEKFLASRAYASGEEYSDKCLYYLALSESKMGNIASAVDHMRTLKDQFASSKYLSAAKKFLAKYPDGQP